MTGAPDNPESLEGRVAIITGAGTIGPGVGVGKATAIALARQGVRLALVDISAERVEVTADLIRDIGQEPLVCVGSVAKEDDCRQMVQQVVDRFGTIDILVNNAAASIPGTVVSLTEEDWQTVLGVGLMGAVHMSRFVVPVMTEAGGGAIVNISSIASSRGFVHAAYASTKGGLEALTRDMAVAHGRDGIRVNVILPGHLHTPRVTTIGEEAANRRQNHELRTAASPLGTEGTAWDVAWAVEFLVSDKARWVTGISMPVDAGVLCTSYMSMAPFINP